MKKEIWVCGVAHAPALHVRKFNKVEQRKGYLFHTTFDDGDGDIALFGRCPEVVPGFLVRHFTGDEPLRAVLPKQKKAKKKGDVLAADKDVFEGSHGE